METKSILFRRLMVLAFSALFGITFLTTNTSATSISSFSVSTDTVNINLTPTATGSVSSTGSHTATITTDCSSGYKVYVSMTSDAADNKLHLNGDNLNTTVGTNALGPTAGSFDTMATLSGNSWGVKVGSGSASSDFAAVPTYSSISTINQSTNPIALITGSDTASGISYTITYGANANSTLTPGEYSGNVLYTAIMNSSCYTADVSVVKGTGIASVSLDGPSPTTITDGQRATYNIGSTATASYTLEPGYHYSHWTASPDVAITKNNTAGSGSTVGSGTGSFTVPGTGTTVSPQGATNTYTIKYNVGTSDSGTAGTASQTGTYGGNVTTSTKGTLAKTGYDFKGWAHSSTATTATYSANTSTAVSTIASNAGVTNTNGAEINLYAVWYPIAYAYDDGDDGDFVDIYLAHEDDYDADEYCDDSENASCTFAPGEKVYISAGWTRSGYHFVSWNVQTASGTSVSVDSSTSSTTYFIMPSEYVNIYANMAGNSYSVKFNGCSNTGGSMNNQSFTYGTAQNLSSNGFSRTGYSFAGWATDSCSGAKAYDNGASVNNLTTTNSGTYNLYALWTINSYTLTTTNGDTTHISSITSGGSKQYNSSQTVTCTPTTGYSCSWYNGTTQVSTGSTYTFTMPASSLTLTAKSSVNSYALTVSIGNTTAISSVSGGGSKTYGSSVTVTCTPNSGYKCTGWTSSDTSLVANSTSASYTFTMPAGNVTLTATAEVIPNMQGWSGCDSLSIGSSTTLRDSRDGNEYTIKKLKDGKCWMTQNLAIMNATISSEDSNLPAGTSFTLPASSTGWGKATESNKIARLHNNSTYGVVYNYYAATGGGAWYQDNKSKNTIITQDICPKGWRLPTGGAVNLSTGNGEFQTLYSNYNSTSLMQATSGPQFTLAGKYHTGGREGTGIYGNYWSSTISSSYYAYYLSLNTSIVTPQSDDYMYDGYSVRCLAKSDVEKTISDLYYMQDINQTIIDNTPQGTSATLTDKRDRKTYTVKKLNDGNIWMTQNLALIDTVISGADSNLPSGTTFTIPAHSTGWGTTSNGNSATSTRVFDTTQDTNSTNATNATNGKWGVLYNYVTASAGTSWYGGGVDSGNLTQDICPKGWRLPTGGVDGEFQTLYSYYNSSALMTDTSGPQLTRAGYYNNSDHMSTGNTNYYWSSTLRSNNNKYAYSLLLQSSVVDSKHDNNYKYRGSSVRCLAKY